MQKQLWCGFINEAQSPLTLHHSALSCKASIVRFSNFMTSNFTEYQTGYKMSTLSSSFVIDTERYASIKYVVMDEVESGVWTFI